jgi:hypothetical protein
MHCEASGGVPLSWRGRVTGKDPAHAIPAEGDDVVGLDRAVGLHAWRAERHAGDGETHDLMIAVPQQPG